MPTSAEMMHPKDATPLEELEGGMEHSGGKPMENPQSEHELNLGHSRSPKSAYDLDDDDQVVDTEDSAKDVTKRGTHGMVEDGGLGTKNDTSGDITVNTPADEVKPKATASDAAKASEKK